MSTPDYTGLIFTLRAQAAKFIAMANNLESVLPMLSATPSEIPGLAIPDTYSTGAGVFPEDAHVKSASLMTIREAMEEALKDGPLSSAKLLAKVNELRPGTNRHSLDTQLSLGKKAKTLFRGEDGRWCLGQPDSDGEEVAETVEAPKEGVGTFGADGKFHRISAVPEKNPGGPVVALPTVADLVRRVAREPERRTTIGIINRVEELMNHRVKRETVSTTISQFLRDGKLIRKGSDQTGCPYIRAAEEAAVAEVVSA